MKRLLALILMLLLVCTSAFASEWWFYSIGDPTYVRTSPALGNNIIDSLPAGYYYEWAGDISYDSRGVAWYNIYYGSYGYGWVSSLHGELTDDYFSLVPGGNANGSTVQAMSDVNVRTGPGTGYGVLGVLYAYQSASYTGHKKYDNNGRLWYQISFYGNTGWVSSAYTKIR